jgi:hypothetical protein
MKDGVEYFPLDVSLDEKFELIEAEFGLTGFAVVVKLYQRIYQHGYYCEWTNEVALLFGHRIGLGSNVVSEIVNASIRRGIFDESMFDKYHILTSRGIQERYFEAVIRRKCVKVKKAYLLVNVTQILNEDNILWVNDNINPVNASNNFQSRVKESRVKKSKEDMGASAKAETPRQPPFICILLHDKTEYPVMDAQVREWESLYPAVNVKQELRKMKGWCDANPARRKTGRGIQKFINAWLSREQDKGGTYGVQQQYSSVCEKAATGIPEKSSERHGQYF